MERERQAPMRYAGYAAAFGMVFAFCVFIYWAFK
jgi:hypothetical protein